MSRYRISSMGREPTISTFPLQEARQFVKDFLKEDLAACKTHAGCENARINKDGKDSYSVRMGIDKHAQIWSSYCIIPA
jgi:hypothetical protein